MKIIYILDWPIDLVGGAQKSTYTIATEMQKHGHDVAICCPKLSSKYPDNKITYYFHNITGNSYKEKLLKANYYKKLFEENYFDIVHIQNPSSFSIIGLMLKLRYIKNSKIKFIFTDRDFYKTYKWIQKLLFRFIESKFEYIICTTALNEKQWKSVTNHSFVIPNVLDDSWYEYDENRNSKNKDKSINTFALGFSGRFVAYKRWDTVYEICNLLKSKDITFLFAFGTADKCEDKELEAFIKKLNDVIPGKYRFLKNVNQKEMMDFYYAIDCFVLTSDNESFGRTLLEAMTKKCIVIGTDSGGVPEVIGNPEFLFKVGQADEAVRIIEKYIHNDKQSENAREYFFNRVNSVFSKEVMVNSHLKIYEKIVK